jgi:hypothetical protein
MRPASKAAQTYHSRECWRAHRDEVRRGKRHKRSDGYVELWRPEHPAAQPSTGFIMEHRVVMEGMIGRVLRSSEEVHHRNGQRSDNRPENLELWVVSQPAGQRVEDRVAWHRAELALLEDAVARLSR